jgi:hypothetical protein
MARVTAKPQMMATWNNPVWEEKSTVTATALHPKNTRMNVPVNSPKNEAHT